MICSMLSNKMRPFVSLGAAVIPVIVTLLTGALAAVSAAADRPNILFIITDQQHARMMSLEYLFTVWTLVD